MIITKIVTAATIPIQKNSVQTVIAIVLVMPVFFPMDGRRRRKGESVVKL